jgi:hypothetical protein
MTERHLSEEELILLHYGELEDRSVAEGHLRECHACAASRELLVRTLALVPADEPPARDAAYGSRVWARLRSRLAGGEASLPTRVEEMRSRKKARRFLPQHLVSWGALAASLALAFWLGRQFPGAETAGPVVRERVLLVALGEHLERSRMVLAEVTNAQDAAQVSKDRRWAESLVAENRLYRQAAVRSGDTAAASLLDELERVLVEVANGPDELSPRQLEELRARIEERGLVFKVKVVEGQVRAKARRTPPARKEISS